MSLLYKGDTGVRLLIATSNTAIPVSTTLTVKVEKPSGTVITWTVDPADVNFTTGVITHTTASGDLNEVGEYKVQVRGVFTDGKDYRSEIDTFEVNDTVSEPPLELGLDYMII